MSKRLLGFLVMVGALLSLIAYTAGPTGAQSTGTPSASGSAVSGSVTSGSAAAPTATRAATATPAATATKAASSAAAGTSASSTTTPVALPATGQPQGSAAPTALIELLVLALACIGAGVALKRRANRA